MITRIAFRSTKALLACYIIVSIYLLDTVITNSEATKRAPKNPSEPTPEMKEDITAIADDEARTKRKAEELTGQRVEIDEGETVGSGSFIVKESPEIIGVLVYRGSGRGSVKVTGPTETEIELTRPGQSGVVIMIVKDGQMCLLSERPTVRFIRPV